MIKKFWTVCGHVVMSFRHETQDSAEKEAARQASKNPGQPFYVMEAIAYHRNVVAERVDLRYPDDDGLV